MSIKCKHCDTDEQIVETGGTPVELVNVANESRATYKCEGCGSTGAVAEEYHGQHRTRYTGCIVENGGDGQ